MIKFLYLPFWFFKVRILGKKIPLVSVIFVSNKCNLKCKHCCTYAKTTSITKSYRQIENELTYCYTRGARFVDFEGGEPTLWRDGDKNLNDLLALAKKIGFLSTTVTTNAQRDFSGLKADSIWVSLDGYGKFHDKIRGESAFDKLVENIAKAAHRHLSINMVVNSLNFSSVEDTVKFAKNNPNIDKISINFHTPYENTGYLTLDKNRRIEIIDKVIALKQAGYPIMNSISGLKNMKDMRFKKYCWISNFIHVDGTKTADCGGSLLKLCDKCGFCMSGEMNAIMLLKPDTVFAGLKLRL
jgi:MoaA/NifB/PqqE/SkfB family radical SAM enzyme